MILNIISLGNKCGWTRQVASLRAAGPPRLMGVDISPFIEGCGITMDTDWGGLAKYAQDPEDNKLCLIRSNIFTKTINI